MSNPKPRDLSILEVSSLFGVTAPTIYKMMHQGFLESYKIGTARRITSESIERVRSGEVAVKLKPAKLKTSEESAAA